LRAIPNFSLRGKEAVIVGRSEIVGKPAAMLLLAQSATVTICHSGTSQAGQLENHIGRADILVAAIGKAKMIQGQWIKKGAVVIDVGINSLDGKMVGDVEFNSAKERAAYITPVPGGVGPVTVVCLMRNAIEAFKLQTK
jgi:methylenetetrahydrofolate dehydrogenase (NADP+)/methenyltetrahydrofolate cyclohydrolase